MFKPSYKTQSIKYAVGQRKSMCTFFPKQYISMHWRIKILILAEISTFVSLLMIILNIAYLIFYNLVF